MANNNVVTVTMNAEKETKGTIRFAEVVSDSLDVPKVGTLYVPKPTLKSIGWTNGTPLKISVAI